MLVNSGSQWLTDAISCRCANGIDESQRWRQRTAGTCRQDDVLIGAIATVLQHFESGCCAAEYDRDIQVLGPGDSEVSGRVTQPLLLFKGVIVFFVLLAAGFVYDWRKGIFRWR